jgi:hypothetical protein
LTEYKNCLGLTTKNRLGVRFSSVFTNLLDHLGKNEGGALDVMDIAFGLLMAAFQSAHARD